MYKDLLEYIVKNLVTSPEQVEITESENDSRLVLKVKEIIYAYAMKDSKKVSVDVEETKAEENV